VTEHKPARVLSRLSRSVNLIALVSALIVLIMPHTCRSTAGPPFVTDDPEPVEYQHFEVFLASIYQHIGGVASGTMPHVEVDYGPAPNLQLAVYLPTAFSTAPDGPLLYGLGDTELGAKYRFVQESKTTPMVSVYPQFVLPSGDARRGLGGGHLQTFLPVWLQKSCGAWTTYGGGGYWINPGLANRDYWQLGWLVQKDVSKRWTFGMELYYFTASAVGIHSQFNFNVGGQYNIDDGHHVVFAFGRSIAGTTDFMCYIGHQWTFGRRR